MSDVEVEELVQRIISEMEHTSVRELTGLDEV